MLFNSARVQTHDLWIMTEQFTLKTPQIIQGHTQIKDTLCGQV